MKNIMRHTVAILAVACAACGSTTAPTGQSPSSGSVLGRPLKWAKYLEPPDGEEIECHYCALSDSGVELLRVDAEGRVRWSAECRPLGVTHSEYRHEVSLRVEGKHLYVTSQGRGSFVEVLELDSGKLVERTEVRERQPK